MPEELQKGAFMPAHPRFVFGHRYRKRASSSGDVAGRTGLMLPTGGVAKFEI